MSGAAMETVIPVIIGILATIFIGALVALVVVCKKRYCRNPDYISRQYLENEGLVPHCLAILKIAHLLTDKLVSMTLNGDQQLQSPETITELVSVARRIGPRVDDVVNAMYPPLDPRLLEARCSALVLSVSHLVLLTKSTSRLSAMLDWVDQSLADVDDHLQALREASIAFEATMLSISLVNGTGSSAAAEASASSSSNEVQISNDSSAV